MTPRKAVAPRLFKLGDTVPAEEGRIGGEIVVLRDLSPNRQQLYFRTANGGLASMTVELDGEGARVLSEPVAPEHARALATLVLAGAAPRMSITALLNILAGAVLAAGEAKGESS